MPLILHFFVHLALADSPLTSTRFARAYSDEPLVQEALNGAEFNNEMARFLSKGRHTLGARAALIDALGWRIDGQKNAAFYLEWLGRRYPKTPRSQLILGLGKIRAHELFSLGYLIAMDDYFSPERAHDLLALAQERRPKSQTIQLVQSLVTAQSRLEESWCEPWLLFERVKSDAELKVDLRPAALTIIEGYMSHYQPYCPAEEPREDERHQP